MGTEPSANPDTTVAGDVRCVTCGYRLNTLNVEGRCPECNTQVSASWASSGVAVTPDGDSPAPLGTPCCNCQNAVDGLRRHQFCRSCNTPVWATIPTTWLRFCDPTWRQKIHRALTWWVISLILGFVLALVGMGIGAVWGATGTMSAIRSSMIAVGLSNTIVLALTVIVAYWLTTPNPTPGVIDTPRLRRITRGFAIYAVVVTVIVQAALLTHVPQKFIVMLSVLGVPAILTTIGMFHTLRLLACRIPSRKMTERLTTLLWTYCGLIAGMQVLGLMSLAGLDLDGNMQSVPTFGPQMIIGCLSGLAGLLLLLCQVALALLIFQLRRALRDPNRHPLEPRP